MTERFNPYQYRTADKLTMDEIATQMQLFKGTISREIKRNSIDLRLYLQVTVHSKIQARQAPSKQKFISMSELTIEQVKQRLEQYHSPEQLSGLMKCKGLDAVSNEMIYRKIYANHQGLGADQQYLRQGQNKQRRHKGINVGIEHRPEVADLKTEIGHWKSDTVIGLSHIEAIVTHMDAASMFLLAGLAKNKTVQQINQVIIGLVEQIVTSFVKCMTFDNSRELSGHQKLAETFGLSCSFANPYHSWERGLNKLTNG
jgi:transposase, IS30 family